MSFLAKLASLLIVPVLDWLWGKLSGAFQRWQRRKAIEQSNSVEAENSVNPLVKAKTAEEIDRATDIALDKF